VMRYFGEIQQVSEDYFLLLKYCWQVELETAVVADAEILDAELRLENGEQAAVAVEVSANLEIDAYNYHIVEDG